MQTSVKRLRSAGSRRIPRRRALLCLFAAVVSWLTPELVRAVEPDLVGVQLRRDDFVGGRIWSGSGRLGAINLGRNQGVRVTMELWLFRKQNEVYRRIGTVEVEKVRRETALVRSVTSAFLREEDLVVIPAASLDLWGDNVDPLRIVVMERIVTNKGRNYYDTFDTMANPRELLNLRQLERSARIEIVRERTQQLRPPRSAFYDITRLRVAMRDKSLLGSRATRFTLNPNQIADPITGRIVGFPVVRIGPTVNQALLDAQKESGIKYEETVVEVVDASELDQFSELRVFLGQKLDEWTAAEAAAKAAQQAEDSSDATGAGTDADQSTDSSQP